MEIILKQSINKFTMTFSISYQTGHKIFQKNIYQIRK